VYPQLEIWEGLNVILNAWRSGKFRMSGKAETPRRPTSTVAAKSAYVSGKLCFYGKMTVIKAFWSILRLWGLENAEKNRPQGHLDPFLSIFVTS
jgi:hypothetical protein